ncbi:hypothetical protein SEA_IOTA_254 [Mycobacterium phage Iota]|uniref:Uncharacterized protein n=3 Tax=Bixzunavirus TaxID=680114 RepID=A0A411CC43_9CAUD|nr:hypothetical protein KHO63_gp087 [Mycobacterium phage QBert]YP_010058780.1 hypothetical protein KHO65_gp092 [Mycobacterium phage Sauce]ACU41742.1 hypothetical protein LRRHOOD_249 [Mycobacterium phage LRRHood]ATN87673.1 hypothetical protein SEA_BEANWATER_250 [Mycobacterium phage BeanWater]ATN90184.1 hypothetical protein SEA_KOGUMA_256 [Mycobacterium phage Koguma]ATN91501.1 hypothetical protein SEA_PHOX_258 [Mycobacterium phage Phox]QAY08502.1 hypothetical protein SEA_IOTA_254 [Mycobacterium
MSDDSNVFAGAETVGQLFDAVWCAGLATAQANAQTEASWPEYARRARQIAVADAHKRYEEITKRPEEDTTINL